MVRAQRRLDPKPILTAAEYRVLDVLWERGAMTVAEAVAALKRPRLAYTTVLTVLRQLEKKGVVAHDTAGRAFVYRACVARDDVRSGIVRQVARAFFGGSAVDLALHIVRAESLAPDQMQRLRDLLGGDVD